MCRKPQAAPKSQFFGAGISPGPHGSCSSLSGASGCKQALHTPNPLPKTQTPQTPVGLIKLM